MHIGKDPILTEEKLKQVLQSDNNTQKSDKALVVDTTAIEIQRPSKNPNQFYSGKHKMFAVKFEMLTDPTGKIVKISKLYSVHRLISWNLLVVNVA